MKKIVVATVALCAASLFAEESFGGIGLVVQEGNTGLNIESIIPNTPAAKSNLKVNDLIVAIDGQKVENLSFEQSVSLFRDVKNKPVVITYVNEGDTLQTTLRRTMITTQQVSSIDASVEKIKGKKFVSTFDLGNDNYTAVFLDESSAAFEKSDFGAKERVSGVRLLQIRNNIISYENMANGKTYSTNLNGKTNRR